MDICSSVVTLFMRFLSIWPVSMCLSFIVPHPERFIKVATANLFGHDYP